MKAHWFLILLLIVVAGVITGYSNQKPHTGAFLVLLMVACLASMGFSEKWKD